MIPGVGGALSTAADIAEKVINRPAGQGILQTLASQAPQIIKGVAGLARGFLPGAAGDIAGKIGDFAGDVAGQFIPKEKDASYGNMQVKSEMQQQSIDDAAHRVQKIMRQNPSLQESEKLRSIWINEAGKAVDENVAGEMWSGGWRDFLEHPNIDFAKDNASNSEMTDHLGYTLVVWMRDIMISNPEDLLKYADQMPKDTQAANQMPIMTGTVGPRYENKTVTGDNKFANASAYGCGSLQAPNEVQLREPMPGWNQFAPRKQEMGEGDPLTGDDIYRVTKISPGSATMKLNDTAGGAYGVMKPTDSGWAEKKGLKSRYYPVSDQIAMENPVESLNASLSKASKPGLVFKRNFLR